MITKYDKKRKEIISKKKYLLRKKPVLYKEYGNIPGKIFYIKKTFLKQKEYMINKN
jgi:hypothetical protein